MHYQAISVEQREAAAFIRLARPQDGNRVDRLLLQELHDAVEQIAGDPQIRAAVLWGSGGVFSLGWAPELLAELAAVAGAAAEPGLLGSTFQFLADAPLPVIAAVEGDALSAGFELALACDLRIAGDSARFGLPDTAGGRLPMAGGTQRLPRLAGYSLATEMILTGRILDAQEAFRAGIVSAVVQTGRLEEEAMSVVSAIAQRGPLAVQLAKEAVRRGLDMPLEQALRYETDLTVLLQTTADRAEGVRAFTEKRPPRFTGE